jgi:hypothetical protein
MLFTFLLTDVSLNLMGMWFYPYPAEKVKLTDTIVIIASCVAVAITAEMTP